MAHSRETVAYVFVERMHVHLETGDKPVILVVLHHTHDREKNVSPQRVDPSQPFKDKIVLSVACLFYEGKLLKCKHNSKEINKVIDHLSRPIPKC
ncbi:unnamed protein product [Arctogadus glacialis]